MHDEKQIYFNGPKTIFKGKKCGLHFFSCTFDPMNNILREILLVKIAMYTLDNIKTFSGEGVSQPCLSFSHIYASLSTYIHRI